jgi:hypothetical protein
MSSEDKSRDRLQVARQVAEAAVAEARGMKLSKEYLEMRYGFGSFPGCCWLGLAFAVACGGGCQRQSTAPAAITATASASPDGHDHDGHDHDGHDHDGHEHDGHEHDGHERARGGSQAAGGQVQHGAGYQHAAGPHGGTIADWGGGKFHVELMIDPGARNATVYVLGSDEKTPTPVVTTDGEVLLTITDPPFQVVLKPAPLDGESATRASRYRATHDEFAVKRRLSGSISAEVDGTPYAGDFAQ